MTKNTARQIAEAFTGVARYSVTSEQVRRAYAILAPSENVDDQYAAERMIDASETAGISLVWDCGGRWSFYLDRDAS